MIDEAEAGSSFFRFKISPDPKTEDMKRDLFLQEITMKTLHELEKRLGKDVSWVGAIHDDHTPLRHMHVLAVIKGRLTPADFKAMRDIATTISVEQRKERDQQEELQKGKEEGRQWEQGY